MSQPCRSLTRHCDAAQSLLYVADITTCIWELFIIANMELSMDTKSASGTGYSLGHETAQEYLARHNMREDDENIKFIVA